MLAKRLRDLTREDIDLLALNSVKEGRTIDFKQQAVGLKDSDKKEFAKDVCAFANANGGDILFGVVERRDAADQPTGVAEKITGLTGLNTDKERLRLEGILRDGIDPRVPAVEMDVVDGFADGPVFIVRVSKSYVGPHMVTLQGDRRFYIRTNVGTSWMDVDELRAAFAFTENTPDRIRQLRDNRLIAIAQSQSPVPVQGAYVVLHIIPYRTLGHVPPLDVTKFKDLLVMPIGSSSADMRYNIDGHIWFNDPWGERRVSSYVQFYRSGVVEAVDSRLLDVGVPPRRVIRSPDTELAIVKATDSYLRALETVGVEPPLAVALTFRGVTGFRLYSGLALEPQPIDRDTLYLPEVLVEVFSQPARQLLRPAFDALWQAAGMERHGHYNAKGEWGKA